ncbi:MAG: DNA polymerase III subunit delta [Rickettsiales bacterium]|jgi:DNA polymerase III subunit delta|nr:DNA polymerase III subunit delta [Rickettsiales bacterium]
MKVANNLIDDFIKSKIQGLKAALIYGADEGIVFERKNNIITSILGADYDNLHLVEYHMKNISDNFGVVIDESNSFSLIPGRKLLVVSDAKDTISANLTDYFGSLKSDSFLLILAGDLKAGGKLRKMFEDGKDIVTLPCYTDDEVGLRNIIMSDLKSDGYEIGYDLASYIANDFYGNRQILRSELNKLKQYLGDKKLVEFDDVDQIISGAKEKNFQDFANKIASLDVRNIRAEIDLNKKLGANSITLCRVLINYFTKLHMAASYRSQDMSNSDAVNKVKPPVFFKQKSLMIQHLNKWSNDKIFDFLSKIQQYELMLKKNSMLDYSDILFADFLVKYLSRV